ncbi:MAG: DUF2442 domain-containing protein [Synergistaceae bacterium]|nr:DUF2442 domain-containing protein [Synergistaceae bacterium]
MPNPEWCVLKAEVIPPYTLKLWFEDGSIKLYDFTHNLNYPCFKRLRNKGFFSCAKTDGSTVVWPGDIDIAPEELYENSIPFTQ